MEIPNVLFILVDALRADHLGCYGGADRGTPHIDGLAREGVVFAKAYSQAPSTRPSVASFMTGFYPSQHDLADKWDLREGQRLSVAALDPTMPTIAERLGRAGLTTAAFLAGNANLKPVFGLTRGFAHILWRPSNEGAVVVEDFETWLRSSTSGPAFWYVHLMDVHSPLPTATGSAPGRLGGGIDLDAVEESVSELREYYARAVRRVDGLVSRLLAAVDEAGVLGNTLVVLTADHGEEMQEHGAMLSHGRHLHRELVHVPLVLRLPGGSPTGMRLEEPVQLIDLLPTILDELGLPPADLPGRSLSPLARGTRTETPTYAFSQLMRAGDYGQAVASRTHHLIETYRMEEVEPSRRVADLGPGEVVRIKGHFGGDGLVATIVGLKHVDSQTVIGPVQWVDVERGLMSVMNLPVAVDGDCNLVGKEVEQGSDPQVRQTPGLRLADLREGDVVSTNLAPPGGGARRAVNVRQKKPGGKAKVQGSIEHVEELDNGLRSFVVAGVKVLVRPDVHVKPFKQKKGRTSRPSKAEMVPRVLSADYVAKRTELYDLVVDPAEGRNVLDERPDIAQELETVLGGWAQSLVTRTRAAAPVVEVDSETLEQLRRMGYAD